MLTYVPYTVESQPFIRSLGACHALQHTFAPQECPALYSCSVPVLDHSSMYVVDLQFALRIGLPARHAILVSSRQFSLGAVEAGTDGRCSRTAAAGQGPKMRSALCW